MKKSILSKIMGTTAGIALLVSLSGCAVFETYHGGALKSASSMKAGPVETSGTQTFYINDFRSDFVTWLDYTWPDNKDVGQFKWIPAVSDSANAVSATYAPCVAWVPNDTTGRASSMTATSIFRLLDSDGKPASDGSIRKVLDKAQSDLKRQGWETYIPQSGEVSSITEGQIALYSPLNPNDDYDFQPGGKELSQTEYFKTSTDYITYRIVLAPRSDGYFSLYVTSPCGNIPQQDFNALVGDSSSTELEIIKNDKNPPAPEADKGDTNTPEEAR